MVHLCIKFESNSLFIFKYYFDYRIGKLGVALRSIRWSYRKKSTLQHVKRLEILSYLMVGNSLPWDITPGHCIRWLTTVTCGSFSHFYSYSCKESTGHDL